MQFKKRNRRYNHPLGYWVLVIFAGVFVAFLLSGDAFAKITPKKAKIEAPTNIYIIRKGDTLSTIALQHFGDGRKWPEFEKYNEFSNVNLILPGEKLQLPLTPDEEAEYIQIRKFPNVTRKDWVLEVKTPASVVTFIDARDKEEGYRRFVFLDAIPLYHSRTDYLVHALGYEGHSYVLVHGLTGKQIHINGIPPIPSPNLDRYVVTSLDLGAGYNPNLIQIIKTSDYQVEWEYRFRGERGPSDAIWLDDDRIVFFENKAERPSKGYERQPYIIELKAGKWQSPRALVKAEREEIGEVSDRISALIASGTFSEEEIKMWEALRDPCKFDRTGREIGLPKDTTERFPVNGDFENDLSVWNKWFGVDRMNSRRSCELVYDEEKGSHVVEFRRTGGGADGSLVGIAQDVYIDLAQYDELYLQLDVKCIYQSLTGGGWAGGSEYPVCIELAFVDQNGISHRWQHGFYFNGDDTYPTSTKVPQDKWFTYTSINLREMIPLCGCEANVSDLKRWFGVETHPYDPNLKPKVITRVILFGGGWDFTGRADNLRFTVSADTSDSRSEKG